MNQPDPGSLTSRVSGGMVWNLIGKTLSTAVGFVLMIVIARGLDPQAFGTYSVVMALFSAGLLATSLGLDVGLLKYLPEFRARNETAAAGEIISSALAAKTLLLLAASAVVVGAAGLILGRLFGGVQLEKVFVLMVPVILIPCGLNVLFRSVLDSNYQQRLLNAVDIVQVVVRLSLTVYFLVDGRGILGVLIASAIMEWGALAFFVIATRSRMSRPSSAFAPATKRLMAFSASVWVGSFAAFLMGKSCDLLLLGMFCDAQMVGQYNLAYTFSNQVYMFMTLPLGNLALVAASELYGARDEQRLARMAELLLKYHLLFVPAICVGGILLAEPILRQLYGEKYLGATLLLQLYMVVFAINILFSGPFVTLLQSMERQRILMVSSVVLGLANLGLNWFLVQRFGAFGALTGTGLIQVLGVAWLCVLLRRDVRWRFPVQFCGKAMAAAGAMGVVLYFLVPYASTLPRLALIVVACGCVYGAVLKLARPFAESDLTILRNSRVPGNKLFLRFLKPA